MRNRFLISSVVVVVASGVLLGTAACGTSGDVESRSGPAANSSDRSGFSVESGTTYSDRADAAAAITKGELPSELPRDATAIKRTVSGERVFVSWKGPQIDGDSCSFDAGADAPSMPGFVQRTGAVEPGVTTCDVGAQASGGAFTYLWMPR